MIEGRVRRPYDALRALALTGLSAATALIAYYATGTTSGIETDLLEASALIPSAAVLIANVISAAGVILLPVASGIDLVVRRRGSQLAEALIALLVGIVGASLLGIAIENVANERLLLALSGAVDPTRGDVDNPLITGLIAFITVARLIGRPRWTAFAWTVAVTTSLVTFLSGGIAIAGLGLSLAFGGALGFFTRYVFGIASTRPRGLEIASALERVGYPIALLRAQRDTGRGRRYAATTVDGIQLEIVVFDRDLEGAGLPGTYWRRLRLREDAGTGRHTVRETVERNALTTYAMTSAGVPTPRLLAVTEIGAESALLAYERIHGNRFTQLAGVIADEDLDNAWRGLAAMHRARIAHRQPTPSAMLRAEDGTVHLLDRGRGVVAATDLQMRLDVAEMVCALAAATSAQRAVGSAIRTIGVEVLNKALPAIQLFAFSAETQRTLKSHKGLIKEVRSLIAAQVPEGAYENVTIERLGIRTILTAVLATIAGYVLITQLANVNFSELVNKANVGWAAVALTLSATTYVGAALVYQSFVPERLNPVRTFLAQFASSFATLVTPASVGVVATNMRYLTKARLTAAQAAASIGLAQAVGVVIHASLLLGSGVAAGTASDLRFNPPRQAVVAIISAIIAILLTLPLPPVRRFLGKRLRPVARQVIPRLVAVAQTPSRLVTGVAGFLILQTSYSFCLIASVKAFGGDITIASGFFVFLAGAIVGQALPTPGGLGGVEAALAAGLTAAGTDAGTAISAVLLFRLVTFWLPTIPGWFAFRFLQSRDAL